MVTHEPFGMVADVLVVFTFHNECGRAFTALLAFETLGVENMRTPAKNLYIDATAPDADFGAVVTWLRQGDDRCACLGHFQFELVVDCRVPCGHIDPMFFHAVDERRL